GSTYLGAGIEKRTTANGFIAKFGLKQELDEIFQLYQGIVNWRKDVVEIFLDHLPVKRRRFTKQVGLGFEVVIEGSFGDAGLFTDLIHSDQAVIALPDECQ